MRVHLYTLCWNEADMLGFFFRHYDPWVERYVVYDDGSTDGSLDILRAHPRAEVRPFERSVPDSFVASHLAMHDEVWKESRGTADWVVITAIDEHLLVRGRPMREALAAYAGAGATLVPALGYQMISEQFPAAGELLCQTRTLGMPFDEMNKLSLFRPDAIAETNFAVGRHDARPVGDVRYPERDELLLFHYKYLDFERLVRRQAALETGLGPMDVERRWGTQYALGAARTRQDWHRLSVRAFDVVDPAHDPHADHPEPRWWRGRETVLREQPR